jgi:hypothetical protein
VDAPSTKLWKANCPKEDEQLEDKRINLTVIKVECIKSPTMAQK